MRKKIIRLTESELIRLVERVINEVDLEPVLAGNSFTAAVYFDEGKTEIPTNVKRMISGWISRKLAQGNTIQTIMKFQSLNKAGATSMKVPPFIDLYVGTSSTGSYGTNRNVAEGRLKSLRDVCINALTNLGIREDVAYQIVINKSNDAYNPTHWDEDFFDTSKMKPNSQERKCFITINPLTTAGLSDPMLDITRDKLVMAKGYNINPDEKAIVDAIKNLQTYSDITTLDRKLITQGGLQEFINSTIQNGTFFGDELERVELVKKLNRAAATSGKGKIAKVVGDKISIILQ
jgi:hypothetical protein